MAVDKLVDSAQLDADLTSVANAIRTKGGTSGQLAFPAGFVQAIGDISGGGGGTDFTAEWERPSDWPALPNDLDTYSGMYVLFKIIEGKTIYRARINTQHPLDIGVTDSLGNFTSLRTQYTGEIDISELPVSGYFWAKGPKVNFSKNDNPEYIKEPAVEVIICNNSNNFYDGSFGTLGNYETVHILTKNWNNTYNYNLTAFQDAYNKVQCMEFYGGTWNNGNNYLPLNANKLVMDGVNIVVPSSGNIYGQDKGRGTFAHNYVRYGTVSLSTNTALRLNMCMADTDEIQSFIDKIGDLSSITNASNMFTYAYNLEEVDLNGLSLTNINNASSMFSHCMLLRSINWGDCDLSAVSNINNIFDSAVSIEEVSLPGTAIHITTNVGAAFRYCYRLESLDLSNVDFSSNVTFSQMFAYIKNLKNVTFKQNAGIANNIEFSSCELLTDASLVSIANALATGVSGKSVKFHSTPKARLSTIMGTVSDGLFVLDQSGSVSLQDYITTTRGWTIS